MTILGIDGALGSFSSAIVRDGSVICANAASGNVALEAGLGIIQATLAQAGVQPSGLDRIAVGEGPGTFTGLRIAISYAKSLAQAWQRPLVAISSFDALEYGLDLDRVLTVVFGRAGIISARYRDGTTQRRASGPIGEVLEEIVPIPSPIPLAVLGAPEDVLGALAEAGHLVTQIASRYQPASATALAAAARKPARSLHEIHADYGERPAADVPSFLRAQ